MPFSIWEYIRVRTRDAVLAGIQDAMDIAEQGDSNGSQHSAARKLGSRLAGSLEAKNGTSGEVKIPPLESKNGQAKTSHFIERIIEAPPRDGTPPKAPERPVVSPSFDSELERRLDSAAVARAVTDPQPTAPRNESPTLPPERITDRPRRGRPPKDDRQGENR